MRFTWTSWDDECDPPEPGKEWLTICEDGEEYAVIVLRTNINRTPEQIAELRSGCEARAQTIVDALNAVS